jgi:hypothetical protein
MFPLETAINCIETTNAQFILGMYISGNSSKFYLNSLVIF